MLQYYDIIQNNCRLFGWTTLGAKMHKVHISNKSNQIVVLCSLWNPLVSHETFFSVDGPNYFWFLFALMLGANVVKIISPLMSNITCFHCITVFFLISFHVVAVCCGSLFVFATSKTLFLVVVFVVVGFPPFSADDDAGHIVGDADDDDGITLWCFVAAAATLGSFIGSCCCCDPSIHPSNHPPIRSVCRKHPNHTKWKLWKRFS